MAARFALVIALTLVSGCPGTSATDAGMDAPAPIDTGRDVLMTSDPPARDTPDVPGPDGLITPDVPTDVPADAPIAMDTPLPDAGACIDLPPGSDRPVAGMCSPCRPVGPEPGGSGGGGGGACAMHSDCTAGVNGRCSFGMIGSYCSYDQCFVDADCATGEVCSCDGEYGSGANRCVPSGCRVNTDCPTGVCSPSYGCLLDGPPEGWFCRTASDLCETNADCGGLGARCAFNQTQMRWECETGICIP